jgi:HSP20 family molecular chaperone IbpA
MKRMYITLAVILVALVWAVAALTQTFTQAPQNFDRSKRRMELREEMHRRIREKLINGRGDQDLFKDLEQEFEDAMSDSFMDLGKLSEQVSSFSSEWLETTTGRTLVITPKDKDQKINIDVNATTITIKGELLEKTATSTMSSAFSNSFPVPEDCDGTKVKMDSKDGKLLVVLPYKVLRSSPVPKRDERRPLAPGDGDVQI